MYHVLFGFQHSSAVWPVSSVRWLGATKDAATRHHCVQPPRAYSGKCPSFRNRPALHCRSRQKVCQPWDGLPDKPSVRLRGTAYRLPHRRVNPIRLFFRIGPDRDPFGQNVFQATNVVKGMPNCRPFMGSLSLPDRRVDASSNHKRDVIELRSVAAKALHAIL